MEKEISYLAKEQILDLFRFVMLKENQTIPSEFKRAEHPIAERQIVPQCFYETIV